MIEVRHLLRCSGCLLARLSQTFAKCMIKKRSYFRTIKRMEPAISAFIFQPPYPLYHFILVVDSLCRSLHIAIYYNPIYLGKCAYPFTGKSLYVITKPRLNDRCLPIQIYVYIVGRVYTLNVHGLIQLIKHRR